MSGQQNLLGMLPDATLGSFDVSRVGDSALCARLYATSPEGAALARSFEAILDEQDTAVDALESITDLLTLADEKIADLEDDVQTVAAENRDLKDDLDTANATIEELQEVAA